MKPFHFSLQTLQEYTGDLEDQKKKQLARFDRLRQEKQTVIQAMDRDMQQLCSRFRTDMQQGMSLRQLQQVHIRFAALREEQLQEIAQLQQIEKERSRCQQELIRLMREMQSLEKLRDRQWQDYRQLVAKEEEKALEDFVVSRRSLA